jgi:V8-like Glu-specific endopeptidase
VVAKVFRVVVILALLALWADSSAAGAPPVSTAQSRPQANTVIATPSERSAPSPVASPSVGALFAGGEHFCTASVVHSTAGDLVLTAAHCLPDGSSSGLSFEPGYHDGVAPYGVWTVTSEAVLAGWSSNADPDLDFAFLTVHQDGNPATLESLTGANMLGLDRGFVHQITLTGYPDTTDSPVACRGITTQSDRYQQRVACAGFPDGTSGGPWVTDDGTVIGVIGGYQLGGDSPDISYSAYFDADIQQLYDSVAAP